MFAFSTGLYGPRVMYFCMANSPASFQDLMNLIFAGLIIAQGEVVVYMDDILIYTAELACHCEVVCKLLRRLEQYDLYLKPEMCEFEQQVIEYLGMIIHGEVQMDWQGLCSTRLDYTHTSQRSQSIHWVCQFL